MTPSDEMTAAQHAREIVDILQLDLSKADMAALTQRIATIRREENEACAEVVESFEDGFYTEIARVIRARVGRDATS